MAETETPLDPEYSPPLFEPDQSDDYTRYLLHSKAEILAVLRALINKGAMITVHFDQGHSFLLTSMIALSTDHNQIILDLGSNEEMNKRALQATKLIFVTNIDKVKVQFSLGELSSTQFEGRAAFLGVVPETLLRLQRREYFRLSTPIANPIKLNVMVRRNDNSVLHVELRLVDVSGGGVGLMATPDQAQYFQKGDTLPDCKVMLPNEGLLVATLCVRTLFDVTTRNGARLVRLGCEFVGLPALRLTMVQRYITRIERERKAQLSGMH
ncbi:flagellar brake protein [Propionivibrio sp.]|uniref:flagellar brake protein n=1 Tax=Propionivibrio sp. TaxID=2212460 RepID=UPI0025FB8AD7|nr:flagellar brake protein [Propionivibrio sp.]MBK7355557.1 flagellar brake protein [Propionivibrio sp.]MBK8400773.1 flagellar brake protein [Propionivibrio sp.]MBK8744799.1 flagellar brake protein [Propionivibrio sp.]MBK8893221.1 flagellar brake protein [Propionivibrio sp.]MBL0207803.1 flagellar brake protein [Propionivibrio sp.]